jgi:hypothetical protein
MAQLNMSLSIVLMLLLAICTPGCMAGNDRQPWIVDPATRRAASVMNHGPAQIQPTKLEAERASSSTPMMMSLIEGELRSVDTGTLPVDHRQLAMADLELHNPRAPMKRTPDNVPEAGSIPRSELERLVAAAAAARNGSNQQGADNGKNESVIIAVAILVPLAVLAASFMVLRKTQRSRSELATSHLSPDFAAPDMSFPATAPQRGMSLGGGRGGSGGRLASSTLDTIPEEQEDLVGKSPFRFRGIV